MYFLGGDGGQESQIGWIFSSAAKETQGKEKGPWVCGGWG